MAKNSVPDLDTTAGNNTDIATISTAEGWLPSTVNNAWRALMAILKKDYLDRGGVVTVGGTANAITITSASPASYQTLITGLQVTFTAGSSNTGATTLNLDSLGAKAVRKIEGGTDVALAGYEIAAGCPVRLRYSTAANAAAGGWILEGPVTRSGTYTPTLTNTTNVAASVAAVCQWIQIGAIVHVSGSVQIDPTAAAPTATELNMSLPVASNFAAGGNCGGIASEATNNQVVTINANSTDDTARFAYNASNTANRTFYFTFSYLVI